MSHIRFARLSLPLAAIGLNAAPTLLGMTPVVAAEAAKPAEPPKDTIRPEIYKLIDPAQTKVLLDNKNFAEFQSRIDQSAAMANVTPYEQFILNQMRVQLGQASGNHDERQGAG
jgi:hypothetical protein